MHLFMLRRVRTFSVSVLVALSFLALCARGGSTPAEDKRDLTVKRIYLGKPPLSGVLPTVRGWLPDGSGFLVEEDTAEEGAGKDRGSALFFYDAKTGTKTLYLTPERFADTLGRDRDEDLRPNTRGFVSTLDFCPGRDDDTSCIRSCSHVVRQ